MDQNDNVELCHQQVSATVPFRLVPQVAHSHGTSAALQHVDHVDRARGAGVGGEGEGGQEEAARTQAGRREIGSFRQSPRRRRQERGDAHQNERRSQTQERIGVAVVDTRGQRSRQEEANLSLSFPRLFRVLNLKQNVRLSNIILRRHCAHCECFFFAPPLRRHFF